MLQQTRVAAVLGYYARFLAAFPSVEMLAEADEERLMKQWEGLGYYSRARNLQKAAKEITVLGGFPDTYDGLLALPGIIAKDRRHAGLLEHDLRHPDAVRVLCVPPRQVPGVFPVPVQ